MKRRILSIVTVVMLIVMTLPAGTPVVQAAGLQKQHHQYQNTANEWASGAINKNNSLYAECDSVPYRYEFKGVPANACLRFKIHYRFTKGGKYAFDFLTSVKRTETTIDLFSSPKSPLTSLTEASCNCTALAIPNDPNIHTDDFIISGEGTQYFTICGDYVWAVASEPTHPSDVSGDSEKVITLVIKAGSGSLNQISIAWGGHLAVGDTPNWGVGMGSSSISGAPFHMWCDGFSDDNCNGVKDGGEASLQGGNLAIQGPGAVIVPPLDFGDAPSPYPTLLANNGARHNILSTWLGAAIDAEDNGQPDANALGDDNSNLDDEDGVFFATALVKGQSANVTVTASHDGKLDAWVDFNHNGNWADADEQIFTSESLSSGAHNLSFTVPGSAQTGQTFARFRFSSTGGLSYVGLAPDGEVEDYQVAIECVTPTCHITASPATEVCAGVDVTLTEDGEDAVSWNWTTTETTSSIVVSTGGTYGVTITDDNGCESYCEVTVEVYELPTCHITASPATEVCAGVDVTLTEDGEDAVSWNWTTTETTSSIVVSTGGTYGVTITDDNGCESYCEITVTVYVCEECGAIAPDFSICVDTPLDDALFISYGAGCLPVAGCNMVDLDYSGLDNSKAGTYSYTVTCSDGVSSDTDTGTVTVLPEPKADFSADETSGCAPLTVTFTDLSTGNPTSWNWNFTGGTPASATETGPHTVTYDSPGTYTVSLTVSNGCGDDTETKTGYITANDCAPVPYTLVLLPETGSNPVGTTHDLTATVYDQFSHVMEGVAVTWSISDVGSFSGTPESPTDASGEADAVITSSVPGTSTVRCEVTGNPSVYDTASKTWTTRPTPPAGGAGGGGCPIVRYLTCDWDGEITDEPLYRNNRLAVDLLGPSPDGTHSLLLARGTHAPTVDGDVRYLIEIRELEEKLPLPENTVAAVAFNITPVGAVFDRDIFLTLGVVQLPENALNATMAYYDEVDEVWVHMESEAGEPNGVAELTLTAPLAHFSIYGILVELAPPPPPPLPAHFVASGLSIVPSVEKIWEPVTFVTTTGDNVAITANIANDGGQTGTYTVVLKLNGETVDTRTVTLNAGQSQQVSFTLSDLGYGHYEVQIVDETGTFTASRTVNWWLIIGIVVGIGLMIWGVVWARRRRRARQAERNEGRELAEPQARLSPSGSPPIYYMFL